MNLKNVTRKLITIENETDQFRYVKFYLGFRRLEGLKQKKLFSCPMIPMSFCCFNPPSHGTNFNGFLRHGPQPYDPRRDGGWGRVGVKMAVLVLDTGEVIPVDVPVEFINCVQ